MWYRRTVKFSVFIAILCFLGWRVHIFLLQDSCLDFGNVWDDEENRCRDDCLVWNKINGCVKMTEEQVNLFRKCRYEPAGCIPESVFDDICLQNNLPLNKTTGECDAEFTPDKCHKLEGEWIYPEICNK